MANAKKIVGDKCCIAGNVPASITITGTAEEVKERCRKPIEVCAPGGGYILAGGASATDCNADQNGSNNIERFISILGLEIRHIKAHESQR